jgi:hypothetical protein
MPILLEQPETAHMRLKLRQRQDSSKMGGLVGEIYAAAQHKPSMEGGKVF